MNKNLATAMLMGIFMALQPHPVEKCYQSEKKRDPFSRRKRKKDKMAKNSRKINRKKVK